MLFSQPGATRIFILLLNTGVLILFTDCYCFRRGSHGNVRYLESGGTASILCEGWIETGANTQITPYYGFKNSDIEVYKRLAKNQQVQSTSIYSSGLYGIRLEKYVSPFGIIPEGIMGVGLDYSLSNLTLDFKNSSSENTNYKINQHRLLAGLNLMLAVQPRYISYVIIQGGSKYNAVTLLNYSTDFNISIPKFSPEYRIGLGIQYYPKNLYGLSIEGGYFGGCYIKTGLFFWLRT